MKFPIEQEFKLTDAFIEKYKNKKPPFGFNGLGEFIFLRTYSRIRDDGKNETWYQTVRRVVEGIFSIQKQHIEDYNLGWNQAKAQRSAQIMFDRIFNLKMIPAGRSLWSMGTPLIMEKGLTASLYNCSFLSTINIKDDVGLPFANAMDFLMCGIGVGADVKGSNTVEIKPKKDNVEIFVIPDSREGWVKALHLKINSFFGEKNYDFDYSGIREEGMPIKTFGGTSSGYKPLKELLETVDSILSSNIGKTLSQRNIVDIFNLIGKTVVAGNVRRSAEIILGENNQEFLDLKNYEINPERENFGWASNNTIYAKLGMDYSDVAKRIANNGEPGICLLENAKKYGRMKETEANFVDFRVEGLNPCSEIFLEPSELCNLVETVPNNHNDFEDYKITLKYAYLYAKTITLLGTNWQDTNRVMLRNRRLAVSMTGVIQAISKHGLEKIRNWMEEGYAVSKYYDKVYSDWLAIPESIKLTTIKPSGTVSLLAGATPGIHFPESQYYIRRVRLSKNSPFVKVLQEAGYKIEPCIGQEDFTVVVEFPISSGENIKTIDDVSMWEQLALVAFAQKHWADNSVSVTITFKNEEKKDIETALNIYQYQLKAVSFLPKYETNAYPQMPYEKITKEKYDELKLNLKEIDFSDMLSVESTGEKYCNNEGCAI